MCLCVVVLSFATGAYVMLFSLFVLIGRVLQLHLTAREGGETMAAVLQRQAEGWHLERASQCGGGVAWDVINQSINGPI